MGQLFILTEEEKQGHRNKRFGDAKIQESLTIILVILCFLLVGIKS